MDVRFEPLLGRPTGDAKRRTLAIGNFDGVHLGHLKLLRSCVEAALRDSTTSAVLTFDPHPASVVSKRGAPPRIQTLTSRRRALRDAGIEELGQISFTAEVAALSPKAFVDRALMGATGAGCVVVGEGFRFGASRAGDVQTLRLLGAGRFETVEVSALEDQGGAISSSRIRAALGTGDLAEAERCLGRPYEIEGLVVHGDERGRTIGYPTANVDLEGVTALAKGVYAADGIIEGETVRRRAAVSLGVRPTFGAADLRLEAYFPNFNGDLYGRFIRLIFLGRLRGEERFDSADALKERIADDVRRTLSFAASPLP